MPGSARRQDWKADAAPHAVCFGARTRTHSVSQEQRRRPRRRHGSILLHPKATEVGDFAKGVVGTVDPSKKTGADRSAVFTAARVPPPPLPCQKPRGSGGGRLPPSPVKSASCWVLRESKVGVHQPAPRSPPIARRVFYFFPSQGATGRCSLFDPKAEGHLSPCMFFALD